MAKYRVKAAQVEAVRYDGCNHQELMVWGAGFPNADGCDLPPRFDIRLRPSHIVIYTHYGDLSASPGDWVIRGAGGKFFVCDPGMFRAAFAPDEG